MASQPPHDAPPSSGAPHDAPATALDPLADAARRAAIEALETRRRALAVARRRRRADNLVRAGLLGALLLLLPLFHFPYAQDQFNRPKIVLATTLLALAGAWWGIGLLRGRHFRLNVTPVAWGLAAWWGAHLIGWATAALRSGTSLRLATERLGWVTALMLFALLLQDFARGRRKYLLALAWLLVGSAFLTALWALGEDVGRWIGSERAGRTVARLPDWRGHLGAGLGNSGFIADWIALSFPVAIILLLRVRQALLVAALMLHLTLGAAAMIVCWSVHSNAGLIVGAAFMLGWMGRRPRRRALLLRRARRLAIQLALWAVAVAWYVAPHPLNPHAPGIFQQAFASGRWQEGGTTRLVIWGGTWAMITARPVTGWGTGNFTYGYPQAANVWIAPDGPSARYVGEWTNAAHNVLLQAWAELGLAGLLALVALAVVWWRAVRRPLGRGGPFNDDARLAAATMSLVALVHGMMNFLLQIPSSHVFLVGLAVVPLLLVDRNRALREDRMEFEFDRGWVRLTLRGEGMLKLRGLGFTLVPGRALRLVGTAAIVAGAAAVIALGARRLAADIHYNVAYLVVQRPQLLGPERARPEVAFAAFERALALAPHHADALSDRAKLHYLLRRWDDVLADTDAALANLQAGKLHLWRAEALLRLGRRAEALDALATALARKFPHAAREQGALALAQDELRRLLALPPGTAYARL